MPLKLYFSFSRQYLTPLQAAVHASPNSPSTWAVLGAAGEICYSAFEGSNKFYNNIYLQDLWMEREGNGWSRFSTLLNCWRPLDLSLRIGRPGCKVNFDLFCFHVIYFPGCITKCCNWFCLSDHVTSIICQPSWSSPSTLAQSHQIKIKRRKSLWETKDLQIYLGGRLKRFFWTTRTFVH